MCQQKGRNCSRRSMEDLKKKLTRSLSGPRRCNKCQKMVYFSVIRCKRCGDLTHKHCSQHARDSCKPSHQEAPESITHGGDEWPSAASPREWWMSQRRKHAGSPGSCDPEDNYQEEMRHPSPSIAMAGLLKIVHWLSHKKRMRDFNGKPKPNASEKHIKVKYGLHLNMEDKETRKKIKTLIKNTQNYHKQMHMGHSGPYQHQQPFQKEGSVIQYGQRFRSPISSIADCTSPRSSLSSCSDCFSPVNTPEFKTVRLKRNAPRIVKQTSISWQDKAEQNQVKPQSSPKPAYPKQQERTKLWAVSPKQTLVPSDGGWTRGGLFGPRSLLEGGKAATVKFARPPCLTKAKTLSIESRDCDNESLCATWPPAGKAGTILEEIVDENEVEADCIEEADESFNFSEFRSDSQSGEESLKEWCIPFEDIEFKDKIRQGRHGDIYRGKWYGEVLIYTIRESCDRELNQFLDEVAQMGMIRHENIVLFMGACIEPQRLAVITSMRKGPTLFEYLHMKRHRLPFHSKHNIARQIAQGMGYLHAKDIIHRKLNSKNIILESRVKLCIMDHSMSNKELDRSDCGCIPRGHLSYISPELMSSLQIEPPRVYSTQPCTQESDIFAFGSLLFELLSERFAFHDQPPHTIIWMVASGKMAPLHNFRFVNGLKVLIKKCWSQLPEQRPPFSEVVHILQENVSHHRRHSCSEPDRLHHAGQTSGRTLCT